MHVILLGGELQHFFASFQNSAKFSEYLEEGTRNSVVFAFLRIEISVNVIQNIRFDRVKKLLKDFYIFCNDCS